MYLPTRSKVLPPYNSEIKPGLGDYVQMKKQKLTSSIITRYGLIMAVIICLSMVGMLGSMLIAESLDSDAARINIAGSLRMQAYKVSQAMLLRDNPSMAEELGNVDLQISLFEGKFYHPALKLIGHGGDDHPLGRNYLQIDSLWLVLKNEIIQAQTSAEVSAAQLKIHHFALQINDFVFRLQHGSENKVRLLRMMEGIILFSTLITGFLALYNLHYNVVEPLRSMVHAANKIRQGDFDTQVYYEGDDELGVLARGINDMASDLSQLYGNLESKVAIKTANLKRLNDSLVILYQASLSLADDAKNVDEIQRILHKMEDSLTPITLSLCLSTESSQRAFNISSISGGSKEVGCIKPNCGNCQSVNCDKELLQRTFAIEKSGQNFGLLIASYPKFTPLAEWQKFTLKNLAQTLAAAFSLTQQSEQAHYLSLMEERAVIARELHDSLAQSLSYLKLQTARLEKLKQKEGTEQQQQDTVDDIRDGLSNAYRQLRELLTTFRLEVKESGLESALQGTVAEYSEKTQIPIQLHYLLEHLPLTANEEIHTLQIVRESLSNVNRHSQAKHASVRVRQLADKQIFVSIEDDGVGLPEVTPVQGHYGTTIMQERALSLGGRVNIENRPGAGVIVTLTFVPDFLDEQKKIKQVESYEPLRNLNNTSD